MGGGRRRGSSERDSDGRRVSLKSDYLADSFIYVFSETNARRSRKRKHHHKQIVEKPRKVDLRIPLNKQLFEVKK